MIETIITSSALILILMALRYLLRNKISSQLQYVLWVLVAIRLLLPFSLFESPVSIMNVVPNNQGYQLTSTRPSTPANPGTTMLNDLQIIQNSDLAADIKTEAVGLKVIVQVVWLSGVFLCSLFFAVSNKRLSRKLRQSRKQIQMKDIPLAVYKAEGLPSPCLFGFLKPAVYLTPESLLDEHKATYVIAHELTHYRQKDHIWSFVRVLCLCIYWFNPLVWVAAVLSRRDSELACDQGTLRRLGDSRRIEYGRTLIDMMTAPSKPSDLFCCATMMTGGKREMTERIKRIAKQPKTLMVSLVVVLIVGTAAVAGTFGGVRSIALADAVGGNDGISLEPLNQVAFGTLTDGNEDMSFSAAKAEEIIPFLGELRVGRKEISVSREVNRDKSNQVHFTCEGFLQEGTVMDISFNFNANYTAVWVDNGIKPSFSYPVIKPNEVKLFFEQHLESVTQASEIGSAEALWKARTLYVGDNSAVSKLLGLLRLPEGLRHNHFMLHTTGNERGVEWILDGDETITYGAGEFDLNAVLLFALIDNLEDFYVKVESVSGEGMKHHYDRKWADGMVDYDVRVYAESPEKLQELIDLFGTDDVYVQYSITKLVKNGEEPITYSHENEQLAQAIFMDFIVKSAAWEGVDVATLGECYLIRQKFSNENESHDFYAYLLEDGTAVLQMGQEGRYSVLSQELYSELVESF
ncbi:M56 family metallopeptidase [Anoxynatronum sibiricum]|uniref:M56 family metallopeptidase n=1 Tax=Anoxynatronum sibiricum TaxID=210623 RepID=A0ABU9VV68_9CLOT